MAITSLKKYEFGTLEPEILEFWNQKSIHAKIQARNRQGKKFYYLDGPPYTSGRVHVGTAWGKSLRDMVMRYKRMQGLDVWDRAGFDMHGLPTENKVMAKLGFKNKEDIEKFGIEEFNRECEKFCVESMHAMIADFKRIGVWMGFDNPYQPIKREFMEAEWWLIKQAHEKKRLYQGKKVMAWCSSCATSLSKHELEYETVTDNSIFVKFKVQGEPGNTNNHDHLIVWTTTPWTIPFNMAVMANPEVEYIKAKITSKGPSQGEIWIVAKALAGVFINGVAGKEFEIIDEFIGEKLKGVKYHHPFTDTGIYKQFKDNNKVHSVVLSTEYVDTSAGSGLVHCAPGCGPEDFEVGKREGIPAFNEINEYGAFPSTMGAFHGLVAKKDDSKFVEMLAERGAIIETTPVEHEYAHCWRCHNPIVFRTTEQWFFRMEDEAAKQTLIGWNKKVYWVPNSAFNAFESWLGSLKDNGITRQRYWGTPAPIWICDSCKDYDVIGSIPELKEKAGHIPENLHKPWIDAVEYKCGKDGCGGMKKRIPDILDVWIDAGTASWSCLDFPHRKDLFERYYPADFILEGKDQIRGWFNLLFVASFLGLDKPSFKAVYMPGFINDSMGRKMSKSLGNQISPYEVIDKYGADTMRYYMIGSTAPGLDMSYNFDDVSLKQKNLIILWNLHKYCLELASNLGTNPATLTYENVKANMDVEEHYILSRLHSTIEKTTELFEKYSLNEIPLALEQLYLDLSRTYVQSVREKTSSGEDNEKEAVLFTLYTVLNEILKMLSPVIPFLTEYIYQKFKGQFGLQLESVHEQKWPVCQKELINHALEQRFEKAYAVIGTALSLREKVNLGVRWPLSELIVSCTKEHQLDLEPVRELILKLTNIKRLGFEDIKVKHEVSPNTPAIAKSFKQDTEKVYKLVQQHKEKLAELLDAKKPLEVEGITLSEDHLIIKHAVPEPYLMATSAIGTVFLNTKMTDELEAEGFSRELTRRVQQLRKTADLQKQDKIKLLIVVDSEMEARLQPYFKLIEEKVNTSEFKAAGKESGTYAHSSQETIKGKKFSIHLSKV